jgi:hypothetical protein
MNKKIRNVIAFVLLSAASLTMLFASPNTQPSGNPQTESEESMPGIPSTPGTFMASWDNVADATGYLLDVSTDDSFSDYVDGYHDLDVGNVTEQVVTDLTLGTTYYYRVRPYTAIGLGNYSEAMTASTVPETGLTSDVTATSPEGINLGVRGYDLLNAVVTTTAATNVTSSSATLNGTVNPNGLTTAIHFEYGTTTNYGSTTANSSYTGNTTQNVTANITGFTVGNISHPPQSTVTYINYRALWKTVVR